MKPPLHQPRPDDSITEEVIKAAAGNEGSDEGVRQPLASGSASYRQSLIRLTKEYEPTNIKKTRNQSSGRLHHLVAELPDADPCHLIVQL